MKIPVRIPRRVRWILGSGGVLLLLLAVLLMSRSFLLRERALRKTPLQQPEMVPELKREELESVAARALAPTPPVPPTPSPTPSP